MRHVDDLSGRGARRCGLAVADLEAPKAIDAAVPAGVPANGLGVFARGDALLGPVQRVQVCPLGVAAGEGMTDVRIPAVEGAGVAGGGLDRRVLEDDQLNRAIAKLQNTAVVTVVHCAFSESANGFRRQVLDALFFFQREDIRIRHSGIDRHDVRRTALLLSVETGQFRIAAQVDAAAQSAMIPLAGMV